MNQSIERSNNLINGMKNHIKLIIDIFISEKIELPKVILDQYIYILIGTDTSTHMKKILNDILNTPELSKLPKYRFDRIMLINATFNHLFSLYNLK